MDIETEEQLDEQQIAEKFGWEEDYFWGRSSWWQEMKPKIWHLFDKPSSSTCAKIISMISIFFIFASIFSFCAKTLPLFQIPHLKSVDNWAVGHAETINNATDSKKQPKVDGVPTVQKTTSDSIELFRFFDLLCNIWFIIEIAIRFLCCPRKSRFIRRPINIINFVATAAFYIHITVDTILVDQNENWATAALKVLSVLRIMQLFKLTRHSTGLKILMQTFRSSARELLMLFYFVMLGIVFYGSLVYYAERAMENPNNDFTSIPAALWWAIITMCTIGYGDMFPRSTLGQLVGSMCALTGVITVSLPVPFIVNHFMRYYSHMQARQKLPIRKRKLVEQAARNYPQGLIRPIRQKLSSSRPCIDREIQITATAQHPALDAVKDRKSVV